MTLYQAVILAIVEGVTEFLPISSTGHLVLVATLLHIQQTDFVKSFEITIQLGAILAVAALYFRLLTRNFHIWKSLLTAFFPSMVVGLVFYKIIKTALLGNPYITLLMLLLGGIAILILEKRYTSLKSHTQSVENVTRKQALLIGLCQSVSVIPGVSRAAATILGGMYVGLTRRSAVEFSFLLAFPTMAGASALDLYGSYSSFSGDNMFLLGVGFVVAFFVALLTMKWLLTFVKTQTFTPFGVYRILLSIFYYLFVLA
ncbi:MAG: undecaprenyl-diphosphatase UppP [bacterium]|nr:undecaprenyl-diphosphatase UppP [bacterium]